MPNRNLSRRNILRAGGLAVIGSMTTLAGCSGLLSSGGGFDYTNWMPAPSEDGVAYNVQYFQPAALAENRKNLSEYLSAILSGLEGIYSFTGTDTANLDHLAYFANRSVLRGDFSADAVAGSLESDGFEHVGNHAGYTLYGRERQIGTFVGVKNNVAVIGFGGENEESRPRVERVIDAKGGKADRYAEANENMGRLTDELPQETFVSAGPTARRTEAAETGDIPDRLVAMGSALAIDGADTTVTLAAVLKSGDGLDEAVVDEWTKSSNRLEAVSVTETNRDGRLLTVEGDVATKDVSSGYV